MSHKGFQGDSPLFDCEATWETWGGRNLALRSPGTATGDVPSLHETSGAPSAAQAFNVYLRRTSQTGRLESGWEVTGRKLQVAHLPQVPHLPWKEPSSLPVVCPLAALPHLNLVTPNNTWICTYLPAQLKVRDQLINNCGWNARK